MWLSLAPAQANRVINKPPDAGLEWLQVDPSTLAVHPTMAGGGLTDEATAAAHGSGWRLRNVQMGSSMGSQDNLTASTLGPRVARGPVGDGGVSQIRSDDGNTGGYLAPHQGQFGAVGEAASVAASSSTGGPQAAGGPLYFDESDEDDDDDDDDFLAHIFDNLNDPSDSDEFVPDEDLGSKLQR